MKSFYIIGLILFMDITSTFGTRILVQDRNGIAKHYSEKGPKGNDLRRATSFGNLSNEAKKQQCLKMCTHTVRFRWIPKTPNEVQSISIAASVEGMTDGINTYYDDPTIERPDDTLVEVEFNENGRSKIETLRTAKCFSRDGIAVTIKGGTDDNHFYLIAFRENIEGPEKYGAFLGLIEEIETTVDQATINDQQALENAFHNSLKAIRTRSMHDKMKSIHKLNNFNHLRACSSAYMVWSGDDADRNIAHYVREVQGIDLKITANDFFNPDVARAVNSIDIIQCAIDTVVDRPQFYLANDEMEVGAAFILLKQEGMKYKVGMRLHNVKGLETLV